MKKDTQEEHNQNRIEVLIPVQKPQKILKYRKDTMGANKSLGLAHTKKNDEIVALNTFNELLTSLPVNIT